MVSAGLHLVIMVSAGLHLVSGDRQFFVGYDHWLRMTTVHLASSDLEYLASA